MVSAWVIPGVLAGVLWKILLIENRSGIVNYYLSQVGARAAAADFLAGAGAGLGHRRQRVARLRLQHDPALRRACSGCRASCTKRPISKGVSAWQRLRWLLIPQLAPVIALNLVLITIASFNTFDLIIPLTGGGPARGTEVISLFMYRLGFFDLEAGRAAAVAVVMLSSTCRSPGSPGG